MNLAFYINSLGKNELNEKVFECLNSAVTNDKITDVSLFYNNIDHNPYEAKFGQFNATDLWNYTGLLVVTTIKNVAFAIKVVNKIKLAFLFDGNNYDDLFSLISVSNTVPVFCLNKKDQNEVYRLTGKTPRLIELNPNAIVGAMS